MRFLRRVAATGAGLMALVGCGWTVPGPDDQPSPIPSRGEWVQVPPGPLSARHGATGGWLAGRFIIVGGESTPACPPGASCTEPVEPPRVDGAAFDPSTKQWQPIADAPRPISGDSGSVVAGERLYLRSSGHSQAGGVAILSYNPENDSWATHPLPPDKTAGLVGAGGTILAVSNSDENAKAIDALFDPRKNRWTILPEDPLGPSFDRSAAWLGNELLLSAKDLVPDPGAERPALTRLAVLEDAFTTWRAYPDSEIIGGGPLSVAGRVVFPQTGTADGGQVGNWGRPYPYGGIFDPTLTTWTPLPRPPKTDTGLFDAVGTVGDRTLVGGHLLNPISGSWTRLPRRPWRGERTGITVLTNPSGILVWGGATEEANIADGYLLIP